MGVPQVGARPLGLPKQLVWPSRVDQDGLTGPTRGQARGRGWRRCSHGLYVPADTPRTVEQRIVEAAARLPSYGGVTGWAGLRWAGGIWFDGGRVGADPGLPVDLVTADRSIVSQQGLIVCEERLSPRHLITHRGLTVTDPVRSLFHVMRHAPTLRMALIAADMAAYSDLVSRSEATDFALGNPGWRGIPRMREALTHMDENAWSPTEVSMRHVWCAEARLPRPLSNRPVFDLHGRHIGTPDLFDPWIGVVGEYDGALHLASAQRARDVRRESLFRALGLECVTMLSSDLADSGAFVHRLRAAYARARRAPASRRLWTIKPPPWWVPTWTVEQRRALDDDQRARFLRLRRRTG